MDDAAQASLARGIAWLCKQPAADGGWHSAAYGQLKDGAGVTALALYALAHAPAAKRAEYAATIRRGFAFLVPGLKKRQTVASPDGSLDYPTYATALWLVAQRQMGLDMPAESRAAAINYLLTAQVSEPRGFAPDSPSYGGWDFLGGGDARGITTGTNISVTAFAAEALAAEWDERQAARYAALAWVLRCQQADGGFAFTPEPMSLGNKAEFHDEAHARPRSYGTATCDGLRALVALGRTADDAAVQRGVAWLATRGALEVVPGFEALPAEVGWQRGLRFYYYAALAKCLPLLPQPERDNRAAALCALLARQQAADGCWQNDSSRMREDDPLVATCFALAALAHLLGA